MCGSVLAIFEPAVNHDGVKAMAPSILCLIYNGITYKLVLIFRYYSINLFDTIGSFSSHLVPCYLNSVLVASGQYHSPAWYSSLGPSRIAVFEDCKATALTTQPPGLDGFHRCAKGKKIKGTFPLR